MKKDGTEVDAKGWGQRVPKPQDWLAGLSKREAEVARLLILGLPIAEIGARLFRSESTIKKHCHSIYRKLGIKGRLQLLLIEKNGPEVPFSNDIELGEHEIAPQLAEFSQED